MHAVSEGILAVGDAPVGEKGRECTWQAILRRHSEPTF